MQLDLFGEIEGKSGEELASELLRFLIVNSSLFRQLLVQRLAISLTPDRVPSFRSGVFCQTEYQTASDDGKGRIDVLVADSVGLDATRRFSFVLAIEVKLWAAFTDNQPAKYWPSLRELTANDSTRCAVVVLAPNQRGEKIRAYLSAQSPSCPAMSWDWEDVRSDLEKVATSDGMEMASIARWFLRYLDNALGAMRLRGDCTAYVGRNVQIANPYHIDFLYKLKGLLPGPARISGRPSYYGLSCSAIDATEMADEPGLEPARCWIGFVKHGDEVIFGIDTPLLAHVQPQPGEFCFWNRQRFLQIHFDPKLATSEAWATHLRTRLAEVQREFAQGKTKTDQAASSEFLQA